jgi:hypothetical protein
MTYTINHCIETAGKTEVYAWNLLSTKAKFLVGMITHYGFVLL